MNAVSNVTGLYSHKVKSNSKKESKKIMMSWEDAVKKGQGKTLSVSTQFLYCQSGILKKICVHKNDSKIKK
ncbi:hypothetical protein SERLA73DRAFT_192171 [Serpula lacrymans var. lacrymans S7.3]|uniref:Uncharacterized protein n=1 Tax=Serpula lacrymans var. lacrymans (strain S7.3) TaxID=936435 RepID=F8QJ69_SERL3|nr:hypothetical protein SERLA73DRAFT_192171 [Serpula lacrymans var. lacrymans S7.3]